MSTLKATTREESRRGNPRRREEKGWQVRTAGGQNKLSGPKKTDRDERKLKRNNEPEENKMSE